MAERGRFVTVTPARCELANVEPGVKHVITLSVRNVSANGRRIRIVPPRSPKLRLVSQKEAELAPGLELAAELFYLSESVEPLNDQLLVQVGRPDGNGQTELLTIPVVVRPPCAEILCETSLEFGDVVQGSPTSRDLVLRNTGTRPGTVSFDVLPSGGGRKKEGATPSFRVLPDRTEVPAGGSAKAKVQCLAGEAGRIAGSVQLHIEGGSDLVSAPIISLSAHVHPQALELLDANGKAINRVDFGKLFYGLEVRRVLTVVNTGPTAIDFAFLNPDVDADADPSTIDVASRSLSMSPAMGMIPPHGQCHVEAVFRPVPRPTIETGFVASVPQGADGDDIERMTVELQVESVETGQKSTLRLVGEGVTPHLKVAPPNLVFGNVDQYDYVDRILTITNESKHLPLDFSLSQPANFTLSPTNGTLAPKGSAEVMVRFCPHQLGELKASAKLLGFDGKVTTTFIKLWGGCTVPRKRAPMGGIDKLPEDFVKPPRVIQLNETDNAKKMWTRPALWDATAQLEQSTVFNTLRSSRRSTRAGGPRALVDVTLDRIDQMDTGFELSSAEQLGRAEHRKQYDEYLVRAREHRETEKRARQTGVDPGDFAFGFSLGLEPFSGLSMPWPELETTREPLWLQRPYAAPGSQQQPGSSRRAAVFDPIQLVGRKFKDAPETSEEMRECKQPLSPKELMAVVGGPKTIDFGKITAGTVRSRNFCVANDLRTMVLVEVRAAEEPELADSWPQAQVIPAGAAAGFDITLRVDEPMSLRRTVSYVINGIHAFKFTVVAEVVAPELEFTSMKLAPVESLDFIFAAGDASMVASRALLLTNRGTAPATFQWQLPANLQGRPAFSVSPESGEVPPKSKINLTVNFAPTIGCLTEHALECLVEGGLSRTLLCKALGLAEAKLTLGGKNLSFGINPIGVANERLFTLKNGGSGEVAFEIQSSSIPARWRVNPARGSVRPGDALEMAVEAISDVPVKLESALEILVRYGKTLKLPISFEALVPQASLKEDDFEFRPVVVGSEIHRPLTLVNSSPISAILHCDLSAHPAFNLQLLASKEAEMLHAEMDAAEVATTVTAIEDETESPLQLIGRTPDTAQPGEEADFSPEDTVDLAAMASTMPAEQRLYRITVAPHSELALSLNFEPREAGKLEFELPLELTGVPGCPELRRLVCAEGLRARLGVSSTRVKMGSKIVRDPALPYRTQIELYSQDADAAFEWAIDTSALAGTGFYLPITSGTLQPLGVFTLPIEFAPLKPMSIDISLPLFLDGAQSQPSALPYLSLQLKATATRPRLEFDRPEVVLPPVPLGHTARAAFYVINEGYDNLELQGRVTSDTERHPLELYFPEGRLVGVAKQKLLLMVSFKSSRPISFTSRIELVDSEGYKFTIPVSATSDASVLTTEPYLSGPAAPHLRFEMLHPPPPSEKSGTHRPVARGGTSMPAAAVIDSRQLEPIAAPPREDARSSPCSHLVVADPVLMEVAMAALAGGRPSEEEEHTAAAAAVRTGEMLCAFICSSILALPMTAGPFPAPLCLNKAKGLIELLELLSGRRVPAPPAVTDRKNTKQLARASLGTYDQILIFLRGTGALLASIKSDYLLPLPDFLRLAEAGVGTIPATQRAGRLSRRRTKALTAEHVAAHAAAWVEVVMQTLRALVFCRVTPASFRAPPFPLTMPEETITALSNEAPMLNGANAYSSSETLLLRWLEAHWSLSRPEEAPLAIADARTTLCDGHVFAAVIASHVPSTAAHAAPATRGAPSRPAGRLATLAPAPCDGTGSTANMGAVLSTLAELGVPFRAGPADNNDYAGTLANGSARELLIFALHLHQVLPHCVPKATVSFAGGLHETVVKEIELSNPSPRPVEYDVVLDGAPCFFIDRKSPSSKEPARMLLRLEPRASVKFPVAVTSAFTGEMWATLRFLSRGDGIGVSNASTLVFELKAEIAIGKPSATHTAEAKLYTPTTITIPIRPPEELAGALQAGSMLRVELFETRPPLESPFTSAAIGRGGSRAKGGAKGGRSGGRGTSLAADATTVSSVVAEEWDQETVAKRLPKAFWSASAGGSASVKLDARGEASLSIQFIPFQLGDYSCTVWLADSTVGEWSYRISASVGLPLPIETLKLVCEVAQSDVKELALPSRNPQLERAKQMVLDRSGKERERWSAVWGNEPLVKGRQTLNVSVSSSAFCSSEKVELAESARPGGSAGSRAKTPSRADAVPSTPRTSAMSGMRETGETNKLSVRFVPREPGTYTGEMLLMSALDVRLYALSGTAKAPGIEATLEFVGPARTPMRQELPIVNGMDVEWNIVATLRGDGFSGPASIRVPAGSTAHYPLEFTPSWTGSFDGELILSNAVAGDKYVYMLKGTGEDPLADDHVVLDCEARTPKPLSFRVTNVSNDGSPCELRVDSDLLHVSGPASILVPARSRSGSGGEATYELVVNAQMGGTVQGSITFTAPDGRFMWYTVELRASPPPAERTIEVVAPLRKVVAVEIPIVNPSVHALEFSVSITGESLYGDGSILVPAGPSTTSYELFYSPLTAGDAFGSVAFLNEEAGEFWYELKLRGEAANPVRLADMQAVVGSSTSQTFLVSNPTGNELWLDLILENSDDFSVAPDNAPAAPSGREPALILPPYGELPVRLTYCPSDFDIPVEVRLSISHAHIGELVYEARGIGKAADAHTPAAPAVEVEAALGQPHSSIISFRNPFNAPLNLTCRIEQLPGLGGTSSPFRLLRKPGGLTLQPRQTVQLPFAFQADDMVERSGTILLDATWKGRVLTWAFPLSGIAVSRPLLRPIALTTRARQPLSKTLTLPLPGLAGEGEPFTLELDAEPEVANVLSRTLQLIPATNDLTPPSLSVDVSWEPLRPIRAAAAIIVSKQMGGRWRYDMNLDAGDAEPDDVIEIAAEMKKSSAISFRLPNMGRDAAPFTAFFTPESPLVFNVQPTQGVLASSSGGTLFTVTYAPTEYGKALRGKLIILTDDMQWVYEVRGSHPIYRPPESSAPVPRGVVPSRRVAKGR